MSQAPHIPETLRKQLQSGKAPGTLQRSFSVESRAVDEAARTATLAFASEAPYERFWGVEILDCNAPAIRMSRLMSGANLLVDHDQRDVVGVVESVALGADRVARAVVRFGRSARAEEVWRDVVDGIRRNVSVGYMIHKAQLVSTTEGVETYRVTDWEPFEVSLVSVPADASVGVGRSLETVTVAVTVTNCEKEDEDPAADAAEDDTAAATVGAGDAVSVPAPQAADRSTPSITRTTMQVETVEARNHAAEISKLASSIQGAGDIALKSIQAGHTVEQFQAEVLRTMASKPLPAPTSQVGMTAKEADRYSITRAIRALVDRDWSGAGLEREVNQAILKRSGLSESPNGGFYLPYEVQKRDLTATTGSQGGFLVATNLESASFIDILRNRSVVGSLGATMLSGLQGNVTIPRQTGANTAYWLSTEATAITEGNAVFGQLAMTPKHVGSYQEISRQLLMQSSPSVDSLVMNDLTRVLAVAIDLAALEGTGAAGQPTGISATAGIGSVTGTTLAYAGMLEFQSDVANGNALAENCAYVTTPAVAALLSARQKFTSTQTPLWDGNLLGANVCGFRGVSTLQVTAASMIFGDFSQVVIADWGQLEIALNPYANFAAAITGIRAIQTVDVGVRYATAFSRAITIT